MREEGPLDWKGLIVVKSYRNQFELWLKWVYLQPTSIRGLCVKGQAHSGF